MSRRATSPSILTLEFHPAERALLDAASEQARTSLGDFVRSKALEAAETVLLERRGVTIPAETWEAFEAWVNRPAETIPAIKRLARRG